jgi:hypothetical protein
MSRDLRDLNARARELPRDITDASCGLGKRRLFRNSLAILTGLVSTYQ